MTDEVLGTYRSTSWHENFAKMSHAHKSHSLPARIIFLFYSSYMISLIISLILASITSSFDFFVTFFQNYMASENINLNDLRDACVAKLESKDYTCTGENLCLL